MFGFSDLRAVQIEVTNRCQAACPMCARNIHGGIDNPLVKTADWSFNDYKQIFNDEVLRQLNHINFCGDYGEPTINNDLIEMCQYSKDTNPNISISINTNGSTRNKEWWARLAQALPNNHHVCFGLDGLEDTHHLHRIGTIFKKIIENAKSFIDAGGKADWHFIAFKHNEHQIDQARAMANELGFNKFVLKHSKRFGDSFPVLDKNGNKVFYIEPPKGTKAKKVELVDIKDYKKIKDAKVDCMSVESSEIFIDAQFRMSPCCFTGYFEQANYDTELYAKYGLEKFAEKFPIYREIRDGFYEYIGRLGGWESLDVKVHSIKTIMNREEWKTLLRKEWEKNSNMAAPCIMMCSDKSPFMRLEEQEQHD